MSNSAYDNHIEQLNMEVVWYAKLRDSQVPESAQYDHYQQKSSQMASEAIRLEGLLPSLIALDEMIEEADQRATRAHSNEDRELDVIGGLILGGAILTCLSVLIIVVWNPAVWLTIAAVLLFVGTVALVLLGLKRREVLTLAREETAAELAQLTARRDALLNGDSTHQQTTALQAVS